MPGRTMSFIVERSQPRGKAPGLMTCSAGDRVAGGGLGIFLPLLCHRLVGGAAQLCENPVEVLGHLLGVTGALGRLREAGQKLAADVYRQLVNEGGLLLPELLVSVICLRPGGGAVLLRQPVGKEYSVPPVIAATPPLSGLACRACEKRSSACWYFCLNSSPRLSSQARTARYRAALPLQASRSDLAAGRFSSNS